MTTPSVSRLTRLVSRATDQVLVGGLGGWCLGVVAADMRAYGSAASAVGGGAAIWVGVAIVIATLAPRRASVAACTAAYLLAWLAGYYVSQVLVFRQPAHVVFVTFGRWSLLVPVAVALLVVAFDSPGRRRLQRELAIALPLALALPEAIDDVQVLHGAAGLGAAGAVTGGGLALTAWLLPRLGPVRAPYVVVISLLGASAVSVVSQHGGVFSWLG